MPGGRPRLAALALLAGLACLPREARAQPDGLLGVLLASVSLMAGDRPLADASLDALVETLPGRPLAMADVRETIAHLHAVGRYETIEADATRDAAGVHLVYRLTARREVTSIVFQGTLGLSERQLRAALAEQYGAAPPAGRAGEAAGVLRDVYHEHGYLGARVSSRVDPARQPDRATLVFAVDAGPRAVVGSVAVEGTALEGKPALLREAGLAPGTPWDAEALRRRLAGVTDRWRARGHFEAAIAFSAVPREGGAVVDVGLDVRPGPEVTIVFEGDPLPEARQQELVPARREASVDEDLLEDSKRRIEAHLRDLGYWRAEADYRRETTDGRLRVVFTVRRGRLAVVSGVQLTGAAAIPRDAALAALKTQPGRPFVQRVLDADVDAVRARYRERGFAAVTVAADVRQAPRSEAGPAGEVPIEVSLALTEGPQTRVGNIALTGREVLPEADLRSVMKLAPGAPFYAPQLAADRSNVLLAYLNRGYRDAVVDVAVTPTADRALAELSYTVHEGPLARVDHVIVTGNRRTSTEAILRELRLAPGEPAGLETVAAAQRRLSATGLFRRVSVEELPRPGSASRDILVSVDEARATTVSYGVGLEGGRRLRSGDTPDSPAVERFELAPRGFFEIGRRNLWGGNRSINLFTRVSLRPKDSAEQTTGNIGGYGFKDYRVLVTYREPRSFLWDLEAQLAGVVEQGVRSSFDFRRQGISGQLVKRYRERTTVFGRYQYSKTERFNERYDPRDEPLVDRLYPTVGVSSISLAMLRDTRLDALDPVQGTLLGADGELALKALGSEVGFAKTFLQGFVYRQLSASRVVFAAGGRLGLATGFRNDLTVTDQNGQPVIGPDGEPVVIKVDDLPASERFYAGGDTTVRGYALDRLGTPATIDANGFPLGGNAVIILNAELRVPVWRSLGAVGFVDAGQVFKRVRHIDFGELRPTTGFGIRFKSPVGAIRADLGFKLQPQTFADGTRESRTAFYISIGQAF